MHIRVGIVGALLVLIWQALTVHYNYHDNWTGLFFTGSEQRVPPELDRRTLRSIHPSGYDGQFYRYLAHDPFLQKGYSNFVDDPRLRCRRILVPLAAYVLALGQDDWVDGAFIAVVLLSIFAGCYWTSRIAADAGWSCWWGLTFLLLPGVLASFDRLLLDSTLAALFAGFVLYSRRRDFAKTLLLASLALFTRETGVLMLAALGAEQLWNRRWSKLAAATLPAILYGCWLAFVQTHTAPSTALESIVSYPVIGHLLRLVHPRQAADPLQRMILLVTDTTSLLATLACLGLGAYILRSEKSKAVQISAAMFIALALLLSSPTQLEEPLGYSRPITPLFQYVVIRAWEEGRRSWLVLPATVSVGVGINFAMQILGILRALTGR